MEKTLLLFGYGFVARSLVRQLRDRGWTITATVRGPAKQALTVEDGIAHIHFDDPKLPAMISEVSNVLISAPPMADGDPVLARYKDDIQARAGMLNWLGYLSTTGVYGDHGGDWVDETTTPKPTIPRSLWRLEAETQWRSIGALPWHIFRLAGIYGPGRSAIDRLLAGKARRIIKPGQFVSRIHVEDIAQILVASLTTPTPAEVFNLCDDLAGPPQDVIEAAAKICELPVPPDEAFTDADISDMARSFYHDNKRVRNDKVKAQLGVRLRYPTYHEGLRQIADALGLARD